jgi:class 3 adenylate cyclase
MGVSPPVADLYPDASVMFADIAGFTSWSSAHEPTQVFTLLETLYDAITKKRGVFKVETIGDSFVAVVGLPEPRKDHAVVMARFGRDCRDAMAVLTRELEVTLGPDT